MRRTIIGLAVSLFHGERTPGWCRAGGGGRRGCFQPDTQGTGASVTLTAVCFSPTILFVHQEQR